MNERICELAEQAGFQWSKFGLVATPDSNAEKFAELIVRECAEVCKKQEYNYWRSTEDQDFTPVDCADAIQEHFGVK